MAEREKEKDVQTEEGRELLLPVEARDKFPTSIFSLGTFCRTGQSGIKSAKDRRRSAMAGTVSPSSCRRGCGWPH